MKKLHYIFLLLFAFVVACKEDDPGNDGPTPDPMDDPMDDSMDDPMDDPQELLLSETILGTWVLERLDLECDGENFAIIANDMGCVEDYEIDCLSMDFQDDGTFRISQDCEVGEGTYTVNEDTQTITMCSTSGTDCIDSIFADDRFSFQSEEGDCEPLGTFVKSEIQFDDLECPEVFKLLSSITLNDQQYREYTYYEDGRIKTWDSYSSITAGLHTFAYEYVYEADKVILTRTIVPTGDVSVREYYVTADGQSRIDYFDEEGNVSQYVLYTFDEGACPFSLTETYIDGVLNRTVEYVYSGENCNYERFTKDETGAITDHTIVERDDKRRALQSVSLEFFQYGDVGNIISVVDFNDGTEALANLSFASNFEYDNDDFPTLEYRLYQDDTEQYYLYNYE